MVIFVSHFGHEQPGPFYRWNNLSPVNSSLVYIIALNIDHRFTIAVYLFSEAHKASQVRTIAISEPLSRIKPDKEFIYAHLHWSSPELNSSYRKTAQRPRNYYNEAKMEYIGLWMSLLNAIRCKHFLKWRYRKDDIQKITLSIEIGLLSFRSFI